MIAEDQNILFPRKYLDGSTEQGAARVIYYAQKISAAAL